MPVFNSYINGRNSFYWDKYAMKTAPGDYTKARITHWLHGVSTAVSVGVKESEKQPLENRVWYAYPGQTWGGGSTPACWKTEPHRPGAGRRHDAALPICLQ